MSSGDRPFLCLGGAAIRKHPHAMAPLLRFLLQTQGNGNMDRLEKLENGLEARRKALIEELGLVHAAIKDATSAMHGSENSTRWLQKLEKWHEELHTLVERLPKRHE